jgi:hypothetical protein
MGNNKGTENNVLAERFIKGLTWWYMNEGKNEVDVETWNQAANELGEMQKKLTAAGAEEVAFKKAKHYVKQISEMSGHFIIAFEITPTYLTNMRKVCFGTIWDAE